MSLLSICTKPGSMRDLLDFWAFSHDGSQLTGRTDDIGIRDRSCDLTVERLSRFCLLYMLSACRSHEV